MAVLADRLDKGLRQVRTALFTDNPWSRGNVGSLQQIDALSTGRNGLVAAMDLPWL